MKSEKRFTLFLAVFAIIFSFSLGGCADDGGGVSQPVPDINAFWGNVNLGYPLVGSTMSLYSLDGALIKTVTDATGPYGGFYIPNNGLPGDFNVEVAGGTFNGQAFDGHVKANIREFNPEKHYNVNDITTILAAYFERHPELSFEDVKAKLAYYLDIPEYWTLDEVIDFLDYYTEPFSPEKFIKAIEEEFGTIKFDDFIDLVVEDMEEGNQWSFAADEVFYDPLEPIADDPQPQVVLMALMKVLEVVGQVLNVAGEVANEIFTIMFREQTGAALENIQTMLANVQNQILDIQRTLNNVEVQQAQNAYTTQMDKLKDWTSQIKADWDNLARWSKNAQMDQAVKQRLIQTTADRITSTYKLQILNRINEKVVGADMTKSIMQFFTDNLLTYVSSGNPGKIDSMYIGFFDNLVLVQLQGWLMYAHAQHFVEKSTSGLDSFKDFLKDDMKKQVQYFVKNAERYVVNHGNESFYYGEFPCGNVNNTVLRNVDFMAELLAPHFGFMDEDHWNFNAKEGVLVVRIVHPIYQDTMQVNNLQFIGVRQNQNPSWLKPETKPNQTFSKTGQAINLNSFPVYTVTEYQGKDSWQARVRWRVVTAKISTKDLAGAYAADPSGEVLYRSNPLTYSGEDRELNVGLFPTNNMKYGFFSVCTVPMMENNLKTFHTRGPDGSYGYIFVDNVSPINSAQKLNVYAGLEPQYQGGKTQNLLLKYCGDNQLTISTKENPYHTFVPDVPGWFDTSDVVKEDRGWKIYARRTSQNKRWNMSKDLITKWDTEAIWFKMPSYAGQGDKQMMAYGDWGTPYPMYFGDPKNWGVWNSNDLRKLFPKQTKDNWLFDKN